jgi:spermidine/putrescine transport system ATP-binding protein
VDAAGPEPLVRLVGLRKSFGDAVAVDGIDLELHSGEFFSLLGPSGCGKTSTLRMIAGFEEPSGGQICLDGRDVAGVPAYRRPVNTVFQNYALFPHMNVADNVGFGLRLSKVGRSETRSRVTEALEMVELGPLARRRPAELSGGQQQRVALARALVLRPKLLLLDEPLGALDTRLRRTLQTELKAVQRSVGITFLYVTHDQEEALSMSDRLAVMSHGRIEQIGTPEDTYARPDTAFVASFLGVSNLVTTTSLSPGWVELEGLALAAPANLAPAGSEVTVLVRPERITVTEPNDIAAALPGVVTERRFVGASTEITIVLSSGTTLCSQVSNDGRRAVQPGEAVALHFDEGALHVLSGPTAHQATSPTDVIDAAAPADQASPEETHVA